MSGYTEVIKTLKEIRDFLQSKMNPAFMNSIQGAMTAIEQTLGDPNVQANLKATLTQLNTLLQNANNENLVGQLSGMIGDIRKILQTIDPEAVGNIISSLNNLLVAADKANMIQNITNALNSVSSLGDLVKIANQLAGPTQFFLYGATGAMIGMTLITVVQAYLASKKDQKLQESMDRLVSITSQQLSLQIQQYRLDADHYLLNIKIAQQRTVGFVLDEQVQRSQRDYEQVLNVISAIDINTLELMQKATEFGNKMLEVFYQEELDNESMEIYLGRINQHTIDWKKLVAFVSCQPQYSLYKINKPILPRDDLNYNQMRTLYGNEAMNAILHSISQKLVEQGGNDLFYALANSQEDVTTELAYCIQQIPLADENFSFHESPWRDESQRLCRYYHAASGAKTHIHEQWNQTNWDHLRIPPNHSRIPQLTERMTQIILLRAYIEYCYRTAPYLCFPRNLPREMYNGVWDLPIGIWQLGKGLVTEPLTVARNLGNAFFTTDGWKKTGNRIWNHPVRFLTTAAVSYGASVKVNNLLHSPAKTAFDPKTLQDRFSLADTSSYNAEVFSTSASTAAKEGVAVATGNIANSKSVGTKISPEEREKNRQSTPSVPILHAPSFSRLERQLHTATNIRNVYEIFLTWYEEETSRLSREQRILQQSGVAQSMSKMLGNHSSNSAESYSPENSHQKTF